MLALLFPAALAALAAWLLPALIHLARRNEERRVDFAALRWLGQKAKPRQRIRFDEWPLLLLRLLLLALLVLWLARPVLQGEPAATAWVVAVPGVDPAQVAAPAGAERRWLAPGFPALETPVPIASPPVASLVRQLDAELPPGAPLTLVVPERLSGLDGERLQLSRRVTWRVVPGAMAAAPAPLPAAPFLAVRHAPAQAGALRYFRAAATAWQAGRQPLGYEAAPLGAPLPARGRTLVWLADAPLPEPVQAWVREGGTALVARGASIAGATPASPAWYDDSGRPLAEMQPLGRGRLIRLTRELRPATMPVLLEPRFPQELRALLAPAPPAPSSARAVDVAPDPGAAAFRQPARELQPWLALLVAGLFAIERWVATRRARRSAP